MANQPLEPARGKKGPKKIRPINSDDVRLNTAAGAVLYFARLAGKRMHRPKIIRDLSEAGDFGLTQLTDFAGVAGIGFSLETIETETVSELTGPILTEHSNGRFLILAALDVENAQVIDSRTDRVNLVPRDAFLKSWTGAAARPKDEEIVAGEDFTLKAIAQFVIQKRAVFSTLIVSSFFVNALALAYPIVFLLIIDKVIVNRGQSTLDVLIITFLMLLAFEAILTFARSRANTDVTQEIDRELDSKFVEHALQLPRDFYLTNTAVDILSRLGEMKRIRRVLTNGVIFVSVDTLFIAIFFLLIFQFSPGLAWIILASLPLYFAPSFLAAPILRKKNQQLNGRRRESNEAIFETFNGIETIKTTHAEHSTRDHILSKIEESSRLDDDANNVRGFLTRYNAIVNRGVAAALLWVGAGAVMDGELTLGQLVAVNILNLRFGQPMGRIATFTYDFQRLKIALAEVAQVLSIPTERSRARHIRLPKIEGEIEFSDVQFRYPGAERNALDGLSFKAAAGETVGIVGPSGSGKSTILKLIQRLYVPQSGRVLVDYTDTDILDPYWLRENIGAVEQDVRLFKKKVSENIAFGFGSAGMGAIVVAAKLAGAHDFITRLPNGYDTLLGQQGLNLSGGEAQRICLARALFGSPQVLLLDEATSSLDFEAELGIQERLEPFFRDRTVLIVAHRASAIRNADRIISIDGGKVIEDGTPRELAHSEGYFGRMLRRQTQLFEVSNGRETA